jgi:hypothetical protein
MLGQQARFFLMLPMWASGYSFILIKVNTRLAQKRQLNLFQRETCQKCTLHKCLSKTLFGTSIDTYGLGWEILPYQSKTIIEHGGNIDGFSTLASFFPDEGIGIITLANLQVTPFRRTATYALYDLLFDFPNAQWNEKFKKANDRAKRNADKTKAKNRKSRKKNTKPSHALKDFAGTYQHPGYADIVVRFTKGKLEGLIAGKFWPVEHYHYDIFELLFEDDNREKISFQTGEDGSVSSLEFKIESALEPATFTKRVKKTS